MLIGYARVSKADGSQTTDLQRDALLAEGVQEKHIYEDHASGKKDDRPGLSNCLKALREGDTLIVWKLDRLGRSLKNLIELVQQLLDKNIDTKYFFVIKTDYKLPWFKTDKQANILKVKPKYITKSKVYLEIPPIRVA